MIWLIKFIQKRPSDKTIIAMRIIFWLILVSVLYYNFFVQENPNTIENSMLFWSVSTIWIKEIIMYTIVALWIFPLIFWLTNMCIAKKKYVRIAQMIFGFLLFYSAALVVNTESLDINELLILMWFFPLFAWITGKCIVSKCLKYGEQIKKIRV